MYSKARGRVLLSVSYMYITAVAAVHDLLLLVDQDQG